MWPVVALAAGAIGAAAVFNAAMQARYRRKTNEEARQLREAWQEIARARSLELRTEMRTDAAGGGSLWRPEYSLHGVVESVPYVLHVSGFAYGWDSLFMAELELPSSSEVVLMLLPRGATGPYELVVPVALGENVSLELFADDAARALRVVTPEVQKALAAIPGAMLLVKYSEVRVVFRTAPQSFDSKTLDATVQLLTLLLHSPAESTRAIGPAAARAISPHPR